eukprot:m.41626 g.41626  ORF g.41626 m.41626 type:complete len:150 (+) comp18875_c0_seq1:295-744(+)
MLRTLCEYYTAATSVPHVKEGCTDSRTSAIDDVPTSRREIDPRGSILDIPTMRPRRNFARLTTIMADKLDCGLITEDEYNHILRVATLGTRQEQSLNGEDIDEDDYQCESNRLRASTKSTSSCDSVTSTLSIDPTQRNVSPAKSPRAVY